MSKLKLLQSANSVRDVAILLGYKASALSYIIYKISPAEKYETFSIPKKNGGIRTIASPCKKLKEVQRRLADFLYLCVDEIYSKNKELNPKFKDIFSHGYRKNHSIMTNAIRHRKCRYVLNVDLKDFFGAINFGRVRGFFIANQDFKLREPVATLLAQICCHENCLPQGAPTSPVVSNLIGHILDVRLAKLAANHGLRYSRYVDDLTFSTNEKKFPEALAHSQFPGEWDVGLELADIVKRSGFELNESKTRVQYRNSRQDVTGLVVNSKINTPIEYRRLARAMAHRLFMTGAFEHTVRSINASGAVFEKKSPGTLNQITGIFSYIVGVDEFERKRRYLGGLESSAALPMQKVFGDLLFYKNFYANTQPTIVCEGKTDIVYLRCAMRSLFSTFPLLADTDASGKVKTKVSFFNCSSSNARFLKLNGGTDQIRSFIESFNSRFKRFQAPASVQPVIVFIDNDSGAKKIFSLIKQLTAVKAEVKGDEPFYNISQKLYVVPTPKIGGKDSKLEDFFPSSLLETLLHGKKFNSENVDLTATEYGKHYFAEFVVKPNKNKIDYSAFLPMLSTLSDICSNHVSHVKP